MASLLKYYNDLNALASLGCYKMISKFCKI